jgi:hypothetical protein
LISNISYFIFGLAFIGFVNAKGRWLKRRETNKGSTSSVAIVEPNIDNANGEATNIAQSPKRRGTTNGSTVSVAATVTSAAIDAEAHTAQSPIVNHPNVEDNSKKNGVMQQLGIFYALGVALLCQGGFSICYHLCPTNLSLQFDTTIMYIICILGIIKIYQV